jgi:hypothetical protein
LVCVYPTPSLKLKIRTTTKYLSWRVAVLSRDKFKCQICHTSVKDNKSLRVEVHHAKTFDDICNENNVTTIDLWDTIIEFLYVIDVISMWKA